MKKDKLEEGKRLAEAAYKWWGSTLPSFDHESHLDEPIPKLNKWLHNFAFPELEPKKVAPKKKVAKKKRGR